MNWIVSELYFPEETSTGHFLTKIAEGLVQSSTPVSVLCSQPTYSQRGTRAPWREIHNGVHIYRCRGGWLNKDFLPFRIINFLTISLALFMFSLVHLQQGDKVLFVTNPPLLPYLITVSCRIRRAKPILLVHDVYPEVLAATDMISARSITYKFIQSVSHWLYDRVLSIIVIGRDMWKLAASKCRDRSKITLLTNWADLDIVHPIPRLKNAALKSLGLLDSFVVQYCGNMGRTHGLKYLTECADRMNGDTSFHFLLVGSGAGKASLEREKDRLKLENITILPRCPRKELNQYLNACDLSVISFIPGMFGVSVPSRMYNIMAAGKPILAIADRSSELALVVEEEKIGWVVPPGDIDALIAAIRDAKSDPSRLEEMGLHARKVAEEKYSFDRIIAHYQEIFRVL